MEVINQHLREEPPDPCSLVPDLGSETAALLAAMLSKDPKDRPTDMGEVVRAVGSYSPAEPADDDGAEDIPERLRSRRRNS